MSINSAPASFSPSERMSVPLSERTITTFFPRISSLSRSTRPNEEKSSGTAETVIPSLSRYLVVLGPMDITLH